MGRGGEGRSEGWEGEEEKGEAGRGTEREHHHRAIQPPQLRISKCPSPQGASEQVSKRWLFWVAA